MLKKALVHVGLLCPCRPILAKSLYCLKILCILTPYHTILNFNDLKKSSLSKTLEKKEKMLGTSIFSFYHNVFYLFQQFQFFSSILFCCQRML